MASCERFIHSSLLIYYLIESRILMSTTSIWNGNIQTLMLVLPSLLLVMFTQHQIQIQIRKVLCDSAICVMEWLSYFTALSDKRWELDVMWQTSQTNNNNPEWILIFITFHSIPFHSHLCTIHFMFISSIHPSICFIFPFISELIIFLTTNDTIHWFRMMLNTNIYIYLISFHIYLSI